MFIHAHTHSHTQSSTHMHCILHACVAHEHVYKHICSHTCAHIQDTHTNTLICLGTRDPTNLLEHPYTHTHTLDYTIKTPSMTFKGSLKLLQPIVLRLLILNWSQSHLQLFRFSMWFYSHFTCMSITPEQQSIIRCDWCVYCNTLCLFA